MIKVSAAQFEQDVIMNVLEKLGADANNPGLLEKIRGWLSKSTKGQIAGAALLGATGLGTITSAAGDIAGTASVTVPPAIVQTAGDAYEGAKKYIPGMHTKEQKIEEAQKTLNDANNDKRQENVQKIVDGRKNEVDSNYFKVTKENPRPAPRVDVTKKLKPFMKMRVQ